MLYIRIEMHPRGDKKRAKLLHEGYIYNVGGTPSRGTYRASLSKRGGFGASGGILRNVWRESALKDFPRKRLGAWHLLMGILAFAIVHDDSKGEKTELAETPD